jgi:hypothetical protein
LRGSHRSERQIKIATDPPPKRSLWLTFTFPFCLGLAAEVPDVIGPSFSNAASLLGVSSDELQKRLQSGTTLSELASKTGGPSKHRG